MDRPPRLGNTWEFIMSDIMKSFEAMQDIFTAILDEKSGCPWDKEQNPVSLCEYAVEECHEMVDAIRKDQPANVCDEMGDVLFILMFIAKKYEDMGKFNFADALQAGADKMRRRHSHVFSDVEYETKEDLHKNWEAIKKAEKEAAGEKTGVFSSVPDGLPPLTKAYRINAKSAGAGFTWEDMEDVERQVESEWLELLDAKASGDTSMMEHELGDMFLVLTELGRRMGIKSSHALASANTRFVTRFEAMEELAIKKGLDFSGLSLDEKDELWQEIKKS